MNTLPSSVPGPDGGPGAFLEDGVPVVAGVVVETLPGRAPQVVCRLADVAGLEVVGGDGDRRVAAVWSATSARRLERQVEEFVRSEDDVIGVFPTFVGRTDEASAAADCATEASRAPASPEGTGSPR